MVNPNKKSPKKKINRTNPGESTRTYKNKPIPKRIGYTNGKSYKTKENYATSHDSVSRNNKNGLKENTRYAASNPHGNYEIPYRHTKTDFDITKGFSVTAKMRHCDSLCRYLEVNKKTVIVEDVLWNLSPSNKSIEITIFATEATGRKVRITDNVPILKR